MLRCPGHLTALARTVNAAATARGPDLGLACTALYGTGARKPYIPARQAYPLLTRMRRPFRITSRMRSKGNNVNPDRRSQQVQVRSSHLRSADHVRVNGKPFHPGHHPAPRAKSGSTSSPSTRVILEPYLPGLPLIAPEVQQHGPGTPRVKPFCCLPVEDDGVLFPWAAHATPMQIPQGTRIKWEMVNELSREKSGTVYAPPACSSHKTSVR